MARAPIPSARRELPILVLAASLPMPWLALSCTGASVAPEPEAVLSGLAILGAAFLLSWSMELAERDIPQALAILVLALVSVLPEYAVDLHFAWTAGKDLSYAPYAVANMTGANRLLIGLGWAAVVLVACWRSGTKELRVHPRQCLEIRFLLWATVYSFFVPLSGSIDLLDAAVLFALFGLYAFSAARSDSEHVDLVGPAAWLEAVSNTAGRRAWAVGFLAIGALSIFVSAEPFAESLVHIGRTREVDEFLLVQWVAPLASESPEFIVAILFALRHRGSLGIGALVSSKVNQWTLLVGAIPIAFAISSGGLGGLPLDGRQTEELLLTSAQSLLAAIVVIDLRFSRREALLLAALFLAQLAFPSTAVRWFFVLGYLVLSVILLVVRGGERRRALVDVFLARPRRDAGPTV